MQPMGELFSIHSMDTSNNNYVKHVYTYHPSVCMCSNGGGNYSSHPVYVSVTLFYCNNYSILPNVPASLARENKKNAAFSF